MRGRDVHVAVDVVDAVEAPEEPDAVVDAVPEPERVVEEDEGGRRFGRCPPAGPGAGGRSRARGPAETGQQDRDLEELHRRGGEGRHGEVAPEPVQLRLA